MRKFKNYYFLGIGGIGMSALARYFFQLGKLVAGYDKTPTPLTDQLKEENISVSFSDIPLSLPKFVNSKDTLIIFTPAIPKNLILKNFFIQNGFTLYKRSKILGLITKETECLAVAGTHGKTTTSTLLSHLFYDSGKQFYSFLGGISENYKTNLLYRGNQFSIVEADEFDRSFLNLFPDYAIITSIDVDHLDTYGKYQEIKKSFQSFANLIPKEKKIFVHNSVELEGHNIYKYSTNKICDYYATNILKKECETTFDFNFPGGKYSNMKFNIPGNHNLENAVAALSIGKEFNFSEKQLRNSLKSFKGIKRRFSIYELSNSRKYIDDYAHHPTEIRLSLQTINELFKEKKILTVFQPHLFSRTRDLLEDFANSLENTSELILLDIYAARELPFKKINSKILFDKINLEKKTLISIDEVMEVIKKKYFDVIVTLGAGNIDTLVEKIKLL